MKRLMVLAILLASLGTIATVKKNNEELPIVEEVVEEVVVEKPLTTVGTHIDIAKKEPMLLPMETEPIPEVKETISLGTFQLTAYCDCEVCCGKWSQYGLTSTGTVPEQGRTVAVDPDVIPYGTVVIINGQEYIAEDTGVSGKHIDVFFHSHQDALVFGVQEAEVFIKGE